MIVKKQNNQIFISYLLIGDDFLRVLINMIKKIIFSSFLLYGFNIIAVNFNIVVPINVFTILLITILGVPGLLGLVLFKIFVL